MSKKDLIKRIIFNYKKEVFCGYPDIIVGAFCLDVKLLDFLPDSINRKIYDLYKFLKQDEISEEILKEARY